MTNINDKAISALRILSADQVEKANSGHPGAPLGCAAIAYELFSSHMKFSNKNPKWENRDRFVLSMGHASALLYSLLHLFDYSLTIDDLKEFRQFDSLTPGHPEYGHTLGVECTTGPLGAGIAMGVGMAMAEAHMEALFNTEDDKLIDYYTYVLAGDGCMMEGISSEAGSLAGTLGLSKLIIIYDSNHISIEGDTNIAFREDVGKRFEAFNFQVLKVSDGNNIEEIGKAIEEAKRDERPSLIIVETKIGYGSPRAGTAKAHGEPLGKDNIKALREYLEWEYDEAFKVPDDVYAHYNELLEDKNREYELWVSKRDAYFNKYEDKRVLWEKMYEEDLTYLLDDKEFWTRSDKGKEATRNLSGQMLNKIKNKLPNMFGGSADLSPSNKTYLNDMGDFSKEDRSGRNIHFGVRELAMTGIANGILVSSPFRTYISTFFVFADYTKPMLRLASIMGIPQICIFTHDSIGVGEDGATHEPIEQGAMLRSMPNFNVIRPADSMETACAYYSALTSKKTPTAIVLTRQPLKELENSNKEALKGGYVLSDMENPDGIIIASGSEVELALEAQNELSKEGIRTRVVSMPSIDIFETQDNEYKNKVLPKSIRKRLFIEALSSFGLDRYVGLDGRIIAMKEFGLSAPCDKLFKHFGFTVDNVVSEYKKM